MISLILPYWDRQEAANNAIRLLDEVYAGRDLEVVVVDDGNAVPFVAPETGLNLKVVRLPVKDKPCSAVTAWNAGVKASSGEIIILSCVEILHKTPVVPDMVEELIGIGEKGYVHASVWCPDQNKWHVHSSVRVPTCPKGTALHFCGAMYKSLYEEAGGMDEDYRHGAGYDDNDFVYRLLKVEAKFSIRDDLVVTHPKAGAQIHWPPEMLSRNRDLFYSKWPQAKQQPINIVCLKAGTDYDPEYVNILFDMVRRNLPGGYPGTFNCITDDPEGLDDGINAISLPSDLETWWGKLYMFKRDLFKDGARCLFFDLDTLILGNFASLASYDGAFATLRDFYHPERLGPAVIAWEAGRFASRVWEEWEKQGKPRHPMGDLWWLNTLDDGNFAKQADILQDVFPGDFCSYKADCHPYPPKGTKVVCFHGQPKPANCGQEWVGQVWKVGGTGTTEFEVIANTTSMAVKLNVLSACKRDIPWLLLRSAHKFPAVIVAGGPSVHRTFIEIKARYDAGQTVIALNGAAGWLNDKGIIPDYHMVIDARPENAKFLKARSGGQLLASQCAPEVFNKARNAMLFHLNTTGIEEIIPKDREAHLVSCGTTVGLAAMAVAYCLGYRDLYLHGYDSSYEDSHHAYSQPQNDADPVIEAVVNGRKFKAAPWMVTQAQQFQELATQLANAGAVITVAGDGLLPYIAKCMSLTGAKE